MVWPSSSSTAAVKEIYSDLISKKIIPARKIFSSLWWKLACPLKVIIFSWLVFYNKNLTWENLRKRSWRGPSRCVLCKMDEESNFHMFFSCRTSLQIWYELAMFYSFQHPNFSSVDAAFKWWGRQDPKKRPILPSTIWCLWKWRNLIIFEDSNISSNYVLSSVLALHPPIAWLLIVRKIQCLYFSDSEDHALPCALKLHGWQELTGGFWWCQSLCSRISGSPISRKWVEVALL